MWRSRIISEVIPSCYGWNLVDGLFVILNLADGAFLSLLFPPLLVIKIP